MWSHLAIPTTSRKVGVEGTLSRNRRWRSTPLGIDPVSKGPGGSLRSHVVSASDRESVTILPAGSFAPNVIVPFDRRTIN